MEEVHEHEESQTCVPNHPVTEAKQSFPFPQLPSSDKVPGLSVLSPSLNCSLATQKYHFVWLFPVWATQSLG